MRRRSAVLLALFAAFAYSCSKKPAPSAPVPAAAVPASEAAAPAARPPFYYDLGSASIDVSRYPEDQRGNYKLFISVCSTCHTTARPVNAPFIGEETWTQYVKRMHVKMEHNGIALSQADEDRILSFLAYDSLARKTGEAFKAEQERLKAEFERAGR